MAEEDRPIDAERSYLGQRRAKIWTYFVFGLVLLAGLVLANVAVSYPDLTRTGIDYLVGLPAWAYTFIGLILGSGVFWLGLRVEADWPEALGASLIAGSIAGAEMLIGWERLVVFNLWILPYLVPVIVFIVLLMIGMSRSR